MIKKSVSLFAENDSDTNQEAQLEIRELSPEESLQEEKIKQKKIIEKKSTPKLDLDIEFLNESSKQKTKAVKKKAMDIVSDNSDVKKELKDTETSLNESKKEDLEKKEIKVDPVKVNLGKLDQKNDAFLEELKKSISMNKIDVDQQLTQFKTEIKNLNSRNEDMILEFDRLKTEFQNNLAGNDNEEVRADLIKCSTGISRKVNHIYNLVEKTLSSESSDIQALTETLMSFQEFLETLGSKNLNEIKTVEERYQHKYDDFKLAMEQRLKEIYTENKQNQAEHNESIKMLSEDFATLSTSVLKIEQNMKLLAENLAIFFEREGHGDINRSISDVKVESQNPSVDNVDNVDKKSEEKKGVLGFKFNSKK